MEDHPLEFAKCFAENLDQAVTLQFARYIYQPQSTKDDREYFTLKSSDLPQNFPRLFHELKPKQEIALQSKFEVKGKHFHIPMLDLLSRFNETMIPGLKALMNEFGVKEFWVYETGRSAHVYGLQPIDSDQLISFFGKALLLNLPGKEAVVDSRWVGHRIVARNGSLRWSCNSEQYHQLPKKLGEYLSI